MDIKELRAKKQALARKVAEQQRRQDKIQVGWAHIQLRNCFTFVPGLILSHCAGCTQLCLRFLGMSLSPTAKPSCTFRAQSQTALLNHPGVSSALPVPGLSMLGLQEPTRSCTALLMELLALPAVLTELLLVAAVQRVPGSRLSRAGTAARWPQGSVRRRLSHAAGHGQTGERVGRERQSSCGSQQREKQPADGCRGQSAACEALPSLWGQTDGIQVMLCWPWPNLSTSPSGSL